MLARWSIAASILSALALGLSAPSHALTLYTSGYAGFSDPIAALSGPEGGFEPANVYGDFEIAGMTVYRAISWGEPSSSNGPFGGQSGAVANNTTYSPELSDSDYVITGTSNFVNGRSGPVVLGSLTYFNTPVETEANFEDGNPNFGAVGIRYALDIYSDPDRTDLLHTWIGDFLLTFGETQNIAPCFLGSSSVCDDIFTYETLGFDYPSFKYMGMNVEIDVFGFSLSNDLESMSSQYQIPEGESASFFLYGEQYISEPSALALLGVGLGFLFSMRSRKVC